MKSPTAEPSSSQASSAASFSVAARAAGSVIALGYLLGLVQGPVVAVVGGLALITFGRNLLLEHHRAAVSGGALAVLAGALGIAALRWGALDLSEIRGVQSVLGPTLLVGPTQAAVATGLAAGAALVALVVWLSRPWPSSKMLFAWWGLEAAVGSLALVTVFFDPAPASPGALGILLWAAITAGVVAPVTAASWALQRSPETVRAFLTVLAGAAVVAAAGLLVTVL